MPLSGGSSLSLFSTVPASGSAIVLAFGSGAETFYDITLSAACALSLQSGGLPGQSIIVVLRGPYAWTVPAGCLLANNAVPVPQCSASLVDIVQLTMLANGTVLCAPVALGAGIPSLAVAAFSGTVYAGQPMTVAGSYLGTAPSNLDYQVDGGAWTTLGAGVATITNGTYSFAISAPAAGSHTIATRATGTGQVAPAQTLVVTAAAAPSAPTIAPSVGNNQVALALSATENGSPVTSFNILRGTTSGGETALGTVASGAISHANGVATGTFTDSSAVNGTKYFYTAQAVNGIGTSAGSTEVSATPTSAISTPAHYLAGDASHNAFVGTPATSQDPPDGYVDALVWVNPASLTVQQTLTGKWSSSSASNTNSSFLFYIDSTGFLNIATRGSGGFSSAKSSVALTSSNVDASLGVWLRVQANLGSTTVTPTSGPVASIPSGSVVFSMAPVTSTSPDSNTFSQLGSTQTATANGITSQTVSYPLVGTLNASNPFTGKIFKALVRKSGGGILWNPDFTANATGATSFADTATTPNSWTVSTGGQA